MRRKRRWFWAAGIVGVLAAAAVGGYLWVRAPAAAIPADALRVPEAYPTLSAALAAARPGDTIAVDARGGPYVESITVDVADLSIVSRNGRAVLCADGPAPAIAISADRVRVVGLDVSSSVTGLRLERTSGSVVDRVVVSGTPVGIELIEARDTLLDRVVVRDAGVGVEMVRSAGNRLDGIEVRGIESTGIKLIDARANRIADAVIVDASVGLSIEGASDENRLIGLRIEECCLTGLEILGASRCVVLDAEVRSCAVGILLRGGEKNEIRGGIVLGTTKAAVVLRDAAQHRIAELTISRAGGDGIRVGDSDEIALMGNRIEGASGIGIVIEASDRALLLENRVLECRIGIDCSDSAGGRLLRNELARNDVAGILLRGGGDHLIADNRVLASADGIALIGSIDNRLVRNALSKHQRAGISILAGAQRNAIVEADISECGVGALLAGALRTEVRGNRIADCRVGVHLVQSGLGTRIEGNWIERNAIGLLRTDGLDSGASVLADIGGRLPHGDDETSPLVENNHFLSNRGFDVQNESISPLYIGGNWWDAAEGGRSAERASVSAGVELPASAWRGVVAIGSGRDAVEVLLGRLLEWTLRDAGFRVVVLIGLETDDLLRRALLAGDLDLAWVSEPGAFSRGDFIVQSIPAVRTWSLVVPASVADSLAEPTVSAWVEAVSGSGEQTTIAASDRVPLGVVDGVLTAYDLGAAQVLVRRSAAAEIEVSMKIGVIDAAIVDSIEETLTLSEYVTLADDRAAFTDRSPTLVFRPTIPAEAPAADRATERLAERLTTTTLRSLVNRVRLLRRDPSEVAREYLTREGVIGD